MGFRLGHFFTSFLSGCGDALESPNYYCWPQAQPWFPQPAPETRLRSVRQQTLKCRTRLYVHACPRKRPPQSSPQTPQNSLPYFAWSFSFLVVVARKWAEFIYSCKELLDKISNCFKILIERRKKVAAIFLRLILMADQFLTRVPSCARHKIRSKEFSLER